MSAVSAEAKSNELHEVFFLIRFIIIPLFLHIFFQKNKTKNSAHM